MNSEREEIVHNGKKYWYGNGRICVLQGGEYEGYDGNMYPYASVCSEGPGTHYIWELIKALSNEINGR